jgi:hypothetical protein
MEKCWANSLGKCGKSLSGEHLVSKGIFNGRKFSVKGFQWCKDEFVQVGVNSITRKCLCDKHNNNLSPIDEEGIKFFNALDEIASFTVPGNTSDRLIQIQLDGNLIERWFLKTLINLSYGSDLQIGEFGEVKGRPHKYLVDVAFGVTRFSDHLGLYALVFDGDKSPSYGNISITPFVNDKGFIGGCVYSFRGIDFFLSLVPAKPPKKFGDLDVRGFTEKVMSSSFIYRCPKMEWSKGQKKYHRIELYF